MNTHVHVGTEFSGAQPVFDFNTSNLDLTLNASETDLLSTLRTLSRERFAARASMYDKEARFPSENYAELHAGGLLGLSIPKSYGGHGIGLHHRFMIAIMFVEEMSRACSSTGHTFHNHNSPILVIDGLGTNEQKERFYNSCLNDGAIVGIWASERGGKTSLEMKTSARKVNGGYIVNGQKFFCTNSGGATWGQVWAVADDSSKDLIITMIPMDSPGVTRVGDWNPLGQRATTSGTTRYENVFVPDENVIGAPGQYYDLPFFGPYFQLGWAAVYAGIAAGAFDRGMEYVKTSARPWGETNFDRAIDDPYIQNHVANMSIAIESGRLLLYRAANLLERAACGEASRAEAVTAVYQAKVAATENCLEITNRIFEVCGARLAADIAQNNIDIFWRNARTFTLHDPVDYRRQRIGKYLLGVGEPPIGWF